MSATKFGPILRAAMAERHVTCAALGAAVGVRPESVSWYRNDHVWPSHTVAVAMAQELDAPALSALSFAYWRRSCKVCSRTFVARSYNAQHCNERCKAVTSARRLRQRRGNPLWLSARRWREARDAIAAFCRSCEPDGVCRTAACELRGLSPLPLVERRVG